MALREAKELFLKTFGYIPEVAVFAPGRVNLIGEHTDYNDGYVFPIALEKRTVVVGKLKSNQTGMCRVVSLQAPEGQSVVEFQGDATLAPGQPSWANYVKGVVFQYLGNFEGRISFDIAMASSVPLGGGLSSSASVEVAVATFLDSAAKLGTPPVEKALRCMKAEHDFANMPCGVMDQFISAMGKEGQALLIDCRTNTSKLAPINDPSVVLVVCNSNVSHSLSGSEYPLRREQCYKAVSYLQAKYPEVKALRDVTLEQLDTVREEMEDVVFRRARHVISECVRTLQCEKALLKNDYAEVGALMSASHKSLSGDFEVSCHELDILVDIASNCNGVYGARMTGGGFGGCTVTLVRAECAEALMQTLSSEYENRCGKKCSTFATTAGDGASDISSEL